MKVLVAHARYVQRGGEETVIDAQEAALTGRGHAVVRFEVDNADLARRRDATRALWSRRAARSIAGVIERERPDVLHVHNNFQQLSPSIYGPAKAAGVKVVQHLHNARLACVNAFFERDAAPCTDCVGTRTSWPGVAHNCYRGSRVDSLAATAVQLAHRAIGAGDAVDRFVAVSGALAAQLTAARVVPAENVVVAHNGVDDPGPRSRRDAGYALYVGRVAREKGIQVLLDAAASVPELPIRVVGDGPDRARYAEQAASRGLRHVSFLGRLDGPALAEQRRAARAAVTPSIGLDPLPTTVIEAAAAGLATIGSAAGGIPEIVGDTGVLVAPGDVVALAGALRRVHTDAAEMRSLGDAARRRYEERFTLDHFAARLEAIYDSL